VEAGQASGSRVVLLAAVLGAMAIFFSIGGVLLALCLFLPGGSTIDDDDDPGSPAPRKPIPLPPISFVKHGPAKGQPAPGSASVAKGGSVPPGIAKDLGSAAVLAPLNQKEIDAAIDKGLAYLKNNIDEKGNFRADGRGNRLGATALIGLTLLSCGVAVDEPAIQRIAKRVRAEAPNNTQTYDLACSIWFLDKLGDTGDVDLIKTMGLRLIAGQRDSGGWDYNCPKLSREDEDQLFAAVHQHNQLLLPIEEKNDTPKQPGGKVANWSVLKYKRGQKPSGTDGDNSNTQFGVLGLWAAKKHGLPVGLSLAMAEARFRQWQMDDGSWGYRLAKNSNWKDAMTCAGLVTLAAGQGSHVAKEPSADSGLDKDPQIAKALLFLGKRLKTLSLPPTKEQRDKLTAEKKELEEKLKTTEPAEQAVLRERINEINRQLTRPADNQIHADGVGDLYFLWSVERVGVLYNLDTIGGENWHAWGTEILLRMQNSEGWWDQQHGRPIDTCFALLFLKRVNVAHDLTKVIQNLGGVRDPGAKRGENTTVADAGDNKTNPSMQPGNIKLRPGQALPAHRTTPTRTRRRRRKSLGRTRRHVV
jgi:hypothetical protein